MFRQKYLTLISKLALVATIFGFFAPNIAQALPANGGVKPFSVEICSSGATKRIDTVIVGAKVQNQTQAPAEKETRLHNGNCPFCVADEVQLAVANQHANILAIESKLIHLIHAYITPVTNDFYQSANPSQAPPLV